MDWSILDRKLRHSGIELRQNCDTPDFAYFKLPELDNLEVSLYCEHEVIVITVKKGSAKSPAMKLSNRVEQIKQVFKKKNKKTVVWSCHNDSFWLFVLFNECESSLLHEVIQKVKTYL